MSENGRSLSTQSVDNDDTGACPMDITYAAGVSTELPGNSGGASDDLYKHFLRRDAFEHNRTLTINQARPHSKIVYSGCHDLDCFLHAVANGVVVASNDKLPGDGLPRGVYEFQMSCRKDLPTPNPSGALESPPGARCKLHDRKRENCRSIPQKYLDLNDYASSTESCEGYSTFRYAPYTRSTTNSQRGSRKPKETKKRKLDSVKFKFTHEVKTVFNPEIWTENRLATKCSEAFENALRGRRGGGFQTARRNKPDSQWWGPFIDDYDNREYWFEGYYEIVNGEKKIATFYFSHRENVSDR